MRATIDTVTLPNPSQFFRQTPTPSNTPSIVLPFEPGSTIAGFSSPFLDIVRVIVTVVVIVIFVEPIYSVSEPARSESGLCDYLHWHRV